MLLIVKLWKQQPGKFFCISTKSGSGKWKDNWFERSEFTGIPEFINDNLDKDVYFCPHGFTKKERKKPFAVAPKLLYSDLDGADPRDLDLRPTIALESSPGRFVGFWQTDVAIEESLNRRLSYSIGGDISGWDFTQVLRVPNTRNFKYRNTPKVKILWNDGPTYEVKSLNRIIPKMKTVMGEDVNNDAAEIFKKYEKKMPRWVRRELINGKPVKGARSEILWKLQNELIEMGLSRDDTFELIWASPWNKFRDRRDGVDQLWRELDKALDNHLSSGFTKTEKKREGSDDDEDPFEFNPLPRSMAEVSMRQIDWLVPGLLARGEITIVEGDPGLGKSYFMQIVAMSICDGKRIPSEVEYEPVQGRVAYFDTENTADTVTKLRLIENGAECLENYWQGEDPFSVDDEEKWSKVWEVLEEFKPTLVVFDTINIYIGGADTYRSSETQQALTNFKMLAQRFNCSVVLLRHLTKNTGTKALYRGQGSIAFTGVARIVLTVGLSPEDQDIRVVAVTKNNIGPKARSFTYTIQGLPDKGKIKNRSKLVWGEFVDLTADDITTVAPIKNSNNKETCLKWLTGLLESGKPVPFEKIERMAATRSFKPEDVQRAADQLGVKKVNRRGSDFWELMSGDENPNARESREQKAHRPSTKRSVKLR